MRIKMAIMAFALTMTMTSYAGSVKDFIDVALASSAGTLSSVKHLKISAKRLAAERDACTTLGYVYGRASVDENVLLKDGRNLLDVLNPALLYCNKVRLSESTEFGKAAESASLENAVKALDDAYRNL